MKQTQPHRGIGASIIAGFFVVLALMVSLTIVGLRHVSETNARLRGIAENNNVKAELAVAMQTALRERALSMHALTVLTDPFDKDAETQRFHALGADYVAARQRLEQLPLSGEERAIIEHIRTLTRVAQPEVQAVMDMGMEDENPAMIDRIRNSAMPRQREIAKQVSDLIQLQREHTAAAVREAEASYREVRDLMIALGASALFIGFLIATLVSRRVSRQARQLADQALYDSLTGLPNRCLLHDRLEQAIALSPRNKRPFAVALMDIDHFKTVNDTLGHDVGDELLREVAQRLKQTVRADDTVARMGGDEFVMILHGFTEDNVARFAEKLFARLSPPFIWHGQAIDISASVGFSMFPLHAEDSGSLIRYADIAMYAAKRSGKGHALYETKMEQADRTNLSLKGELREAIQEGRLTLYYQPKISNGDCGLVGLEALVRWEHPKLGLLTPDQFVPLAEGSGLIGPLTQWVLKTALAQLAELHARGHPLNMSVNLSARSLHDLELPQLVSELLAGSGVAAKFLTLEVTESAVMAHPDSAMVILARLDRMGITLAIDDFGTGYSSLSHLKQLPMDEIKIDKSFVMDMEKNENDAVIVRSTINLAHNLGLKVVAEGVETKEAWAMLNALGCDHAQGYYLSRPLPPERLTAWLDNFSGALQASLRPSRAAPAVI